VVKEVHTRKHKDLESFGHRSVIPYVHSFCIAPIRTWSTKLEEARGCECFLRKAFELILELAKLVFS
jgi:hypothetical protein